MYKYVTKAVDLNGILFIKPDLNHHRRMHGGAERR
jgi:hypothetical protein